MGKFKDKRGHTRWQEGKADVKTFLEKHGDEIAPVLKAVVKVAAPRAGQVIQLIEAIQAVKGNQVLKDKALNQLSQLVDDLDDDEEETTLQHSYASGDSQAQAFDPSDLLKLVNSTKASKYITPVFTILTGLMMMFMHGVNAAFKLGFEVVPYSPMELGEITFLFGTMFGVRQLVRNDAKKKIINV